MTAEVSEPQGHVFELPERAQGRAIVAIARKELGDAVRSRWFWMWASAFAVLAAVLALAALPGSRIAGAASYGRTAASLVALTQIIVPLMALTLGAQTIAAQRESGALRFLLSHPVNRTEAFWGLYLGTAAALTAAAFAGFGAAGVVTALRSGGGEAGSYLRITFLAWALLLAMLGLGMLISTFARRASAALGSAVFLWLVLVFVGDLGLMGTAIATRLSVSTLFFSTIANPVEAFRLASLASFADSLDVLGPAGTYAVDALGGALLPVIVGSLLAWMAIPVTIAWNRFRNRQDL
ncbi:MAG TPA: ABC transporter permease [Acidimicrobiia bacterium]|nr:ABC transporter permease [Acidimicrobiia bacterium]